jgi:hypothetical protein
MVAGTVESQNIDSIEAIIQSLCKRKSCVFLATRGTLSKQYLIGRMFNRFDTNSTHVAIGIIKNCSIKIFSVEDRLGRNSQLRVSGLREFLHYPDMFYFSIWSVRMKSKETGSIIRTCNKMLQKKIEFDYDFDLNNGDRFYCSEFCAEVLNKNAPRRRRLKPVSKNIYGLYSNFLDRKLITYFPVDFFQDSFRFEKVVEIKF